MEEPVYVNRKEIKYVEQLLNDINEHGILCSIISLGGAGKTTFLQALKQNLEEKHSNIFCIYESIKQIDAPSDFFYRLIIEMQSVLNPTKYKIKKFFGKNQTLFKATSQLAGSIPFVPPGLSGVVDQGLSLVSPTKLTGQSEVYSEFINVLNDFSKKFEDRKMILMIDDIDQSIQKETFYPLINSIKQDLPSRIMIITTSSDHIPADHTIKLENFDENQIREFMTTNFGKIEEDVISDVIKKSEGYPASLGWLWQNYKRGEDVSSLLARFSKDGFIDQLQKNFLDDFISKLKDEEINTLKICTHLVFADVYSVSTLTSIDILNVEKYLKHFEKKGILSMIANISLTNGQIIEAYSTSPLFKKAIKTKFGTQFDTYIKATNYFANSLKNIRYPNPMSIVGVMLEQYSYLRRDVSPELFFNTIDMNPEDELVLCSVIINYYIGARNIEKAKDFINFIQSLSKNIKNRNTAKAWDMFIEMVLPFIDAKHEEKNKILNIAQEIESILSNEGTTTENTLLLINVKTIKGIVLASETQDRNSSIEKILEEATKSLLPLSSSKKVSKIVMFTIAGEGCIGSKNYDGAIFFLSDAVKELENLNDQDKKEVERIFNLATPESLLSLSDFKVKIGNELGMAYFYQTMMMAQSDDFDMDTLINNMRVSVNYLKSAQFDPAYGKLYALAKELLETFDLNNNVFES